MVSKMTKKVERTAEPAQVQVPWGQPPADPLLEDAADAFAQMPDASPNFAPPTGPDPMIPANSGLAPTESVFSGEVPKQASPFAPPPKAKIVPEPEKFEMGDAPLWGDLVRFVQKHGDVIIQCRHPQPRGIAVDTIYRGVTCFAHPTCELRHIKHGWVSWADAQYN